MAGMEDEQKMILQACGRVSRWIWLAAMLAGCATPRSVCFNSEPPGAKVDISGRQYDTPCWTLVYTHDRKATFAWPGEPPQTVKIPPQQGVLSRSAHYLGRMGSATCKVIGIPLVFIGALGLYGLGQEGAKLAGDNRDDDAPWMLGGCAAALGIGGLLWWAGDAADGSIPELVKDDLYITGNLHGGAGAETGR